MKSQSLGTEGWGAAHYLLRPSSGKWKMFLLRITFPPLDMSHLGDLKFPKDSSDLEEILQKSTWG